MMEPSMWKSGSGLMGAVDAIPCCQDSSFRRHVMMKLTLRSLSGVELSEMVNEEYDSRRP